MFCTKCGTQLKEGSSFCHNCGAKIKQAAAASPEQAAPQAGFVPSQPSQWADSGQDPYGQVGSSGNESAPVPPAPTNRNGKVIAAVISAVVIGAFFAVFVTASLFGFLYSLDNQSSLTQKEQDANSIFDSLGDGSSSGSTSTDDNGSSNGDSSSNDKASYVGVWYAVAMYDADEGESYDRSDMEYLEESGSAITMTFSEDGTWHMDMGSDRAITAKWKMSGNYASVIYEGSDVFDLNIKNDQIYLESDGSSLTFEKRSSSVDSSDTFAGPSV